MYHHTKVQGSAIAGEGASRRRALLPPYAGCPYISIVAWYSTQGQRSDQLLNRQCAILTDGHKRGSQEAMYVHLVCFKGWIPSQERRSSCPPSVYVPIV